ncbi:Na+/H+ antiporter subunit A [Paractinoplanes rishiriensis]|uniref:Monovalent cation/H+ antiporter subunit A n=1 Tax=Paractinoplanes rishiriensis TaxID=1050105 RepID=A0A919MZ07_9ACTN|nr:Na+/H+ antiporter subunit A [Actinoplanes rishiriensis]GIF00884.1 monovalent cation/H+ antiporter subunit A [Actinoplanes rishiriensis]
MLILLIAHLAAALVAPGIVRSMGLRAFYLLAAVPAAGLGWALTHTAAMRDGRAVAEVYPWAGQLGADVALRMTSLSWLMVLLVGGVGALALVYCGRYFPAGEPGLGRFAGVFVGFAGAMLGLVIADNLIVLYVFWELTTVFSYLLIGHDPTSRAGRRAALQALIVTTLGGLAMLVGIIMLGEHADGYRWSQVAVTLPDGGYLAAAVVLLLLGALSKSAIFPFSFWLPRAMAAPTPVSAYLHAAAMVKAGVFLIGLLSPVLAGAVPWRPVVLGAGIVTMLFGGWTALRQDDLKLLLAYGTVSQLGLLAVALGAGFRDAALAGAMMLLAHAMFKAALFFVVGVVDHATGTRDLRHLSGLRHAAPALWVVAVLAAISMAGVPPMAGFVGKEAIFDAFLGGDWWQWTVLAGVVSGSVLTVAYTLRFLWGAFADKPGVAPRAVRRVPWSLLAPAAVLAVAGLAAGLSASALDGLLAGYADTYPDAGRYHLALWHGATPALALSALALAGGTAVFAVTMRTRWWRGVRLPLDGAAVYERATGGLGRLAVEVTGATQRGSLPIYLGTILTVLVLLGGTALLAGRPVPGGFRPWDNPLQLVPAVALVIAAVFAVRANRRLAAVVLVGVTGYATAMLFVLHGAPDLALTQFLVETCTMVMFVLVLRRLPGHFSVRPLVASRWLQVGIGVAVGAVISGLAYVATAGRQAVSISTAFAEPAVSYGGGRNIVNVTLVDIRAWDTMGEISVLLVAATGVASLVFGGSRRLRRGVRRPPLPTPPRGQVWLMAGHTLDAGLRSPILEVVTRLVFHTIVLFSVYLLFAGHNAPGGGFAGGLVVGLALVLRYLAGGRHELDVAAPVDAGVIMGAGLFIALGTGLTALVAGGEVLQSALLDWHLPVLGHVHFVTSMVFDVGVYLVVIGVVLNILRSLGAEVDRHEQSERAEAIAREEELV